MCMEATFRKGAGHHSVSMANHWRRGKINLRVISEDEHVLNLTIKDSKDAECLLIQGAVSAGIEASRLSIYFWKEDNFAKLLNQSDVPLT